MPVPLSELLGLVPEDVERQVRSTRDRARNVLREALRAECRLTMRAEEEESGPAAQVPIEVVPGFPLALKSVSFPDDARQILLLSQFREALVSAAEGTEGLLKLHSGLSALSGSEDWTSVKYAELEATRKWARDMLGRLEGNDPVAKVLALSEDILGAYIYRADSSDELRPNNARIELYWCVIGLVSSWLGCKVEDLTVVVLAHELAHAYTQLGADIEGRRWPSLDFGKAETFLKEGLAQFYTLRVLRRTQDRFPSALGIFDLLLNKQPEAYHVHVSWNEISAEAVRQAMIETRRAREGKLEEFRVRLDRAAQVLRPIESRPVAKGLLP